MTSLDSGDRILFGDIPLTPISDCDGSMSLLFGVSSPLAKKRLFENDSDTVGEDVKTSAPWSITVDPELVLPPSSAAAIDGENDLLKTREANIAKREEMLKTLGLHNTAAKVEMRRCSHVGEDKKRRRVFDDDDYEDESESESESYDDEEEKPAKKKKEKVVVSKKLRVSQPKTSVERMVVVAKEKMPDFDAFFTTLPCVDQVAYLMNPDNYETLSSVIVNHYGGAIAPMSKLVGEFYYVSNELCQEARHYFLEAMPGRNVDFRETLSKVGTKLSARVIPDFFSVGCTTDAWTYKVSKDMAEYFFARFKKFSVEELKMTPAKKTKQGNQTSLNFGLCYDDSRRVFPDSKEKVVRDEMLSRGYTVSAQTGFIELVVDKKYETAEDVMGTATAKKLSVEISLAEKINKAKESGDKKFARYVSVGGTKNDLPRTAEEWAVCTVFNTTGKVLSFATFKDNDYISCSKRKRPDAKYPFGTLAFS